MSNFPTRGGTAGARYWFDASPPFTYHKTMDAVTHPLLLRLSAQVKSDPEVLAALLFGSRARGDASSESDFDVCLVLGPDVRSDLAAAHKRLAYLAEADLDFVIFQQLPLHIRSRVLKEGKVIFVRDEDALYALAIRTARAFEAFRHVYRQYLDRVSCD